MAGSFQKEIPQARINITLDVDTAGARKKKELPLKLLVIGDFSSRGGSRTARTTRTSHNVPVAERERINVNKNNFNKITADLAPELNFTVANKINNDGSDMRVVLKMDGLQKFRPEAVIQAIPELRNLLAMRNLLKDLKANLLDNNEFRRELEKILKNGPELKLLQNELRQNTPLE